MDSYFVYSYLFSYIRKNCDIRAVAGRVPSLFDLFPKDLSSPCPSGQDRRWTPLHPLLGRDTMAGPYRIHTGLPD